MTLQQLQIPTHYDPDNASRWEYSPDQQLLFDRARDWAERQGIRPSGADRTRIHLLLIDLQKDFCFPQGSLYVAGRSGTGAIDDSRRIAEFIYRNLGVITATTVTMDSHYPYQIFFSSFWENAEGRPVAPYTFIDVEDIESGRLRPTPPIASWISSGDYGWLESQVKHYCRELKKTGKYQLYLWPYHCLLGSDGHPLAGVIQEARLFHSFARQVQAYVEIKGDNSLTENYSVLRPEVLTTFEGEALAQKNSSFLRKLLDNDAVAIAGQASSHCVANTIADLLDEIAAQDPGLVSKVYILSDCMSAVVVRDPSGQIVADFTPEAEAALARFAAAGMHVVKSTDPIESWPGMRL